MATKTGRCMTSEQKKRLVAFMRKQPPEYLLGKVNSVITHADIRNMWHRVAIMCNAIRGPRKTWRQWRKTWQDLRSHTKKRCKNGAVQELTAAEKEILLGAKIVTSTTPRDQEGEGEPAEYEQETLEPEIFFEEAATGNVSDLSEQDCLDTDPIDQKVGKRKTKRNYTITDPDPVDKEGCAINSEIILLQEKRNTEIKQDYFKYKKEYLAQKLILMKTQTEALYAIAQSLSGLK